MFLGCGGCAIENTLAGSGVLGGMWQCIGGMVVGRGGGCATDNTVEAVDGVVQRMTRGLWATAFGDMQRCCRGKGVGAMGSVVGGRHALVGRDCCRPLAQPRDSMTREERAALDEQNLLLKEGKRGLRRTPKWIFMRIKTDSCKA